MQVSNNENMASCLMLNYCVIIYEVCVHYKCEILEELLKLYIEFAYQIVVVKCTYRSRNLFVIFICNIALLDSIPLSFSV